MRTGQQKQLYVLLLTILSGSEQAQTAVHTSAANAMCIYFFIALFSQHFLHLAHGIIELALRNLVGIFGLVK